MKIYATLFVLLLFMRFGIAQQNCPIIPKPVSAVSRPGVFILKPGVKIIAGASDIKGVSAYLQQNIQQQYHINLPKTAKASGPVIKLILTPGSGAAEAYAINMDSRNVEISGATPAAVFYGVTTFLQLVALAQQQDNAITINCWKINDEPIYAWRGLMLDESRHFMGKEKVKQLLNWMAFYKLNRFHWHLTDEPAWRLEIKQYPKLTWVGGAGSTTKPNDPARYYTQEEIKEIINYAAERYITVIPEIDMPGHATAANRAYPEFSGGGSAGHPDFTFNPGNPATYTYLGNILKETIALFPSGMIHVGGDEVSIGNEKWKTDNSIATLMQQQKLATLPDVEHYFMKRMADTVYKQRAKLLVWDEMAGAGLPRDSTIIFWWRQDQPQQLKLALSKGYTTVVCPRLPFYFDFVQDSTHRYGRKWNKLYNSIQKVYNFSLKPYNLSAAESGHVAGIQANLWTETVPTAQRMDYLLFPRISALAETAWTAPENKDRAAFMDKLKAHLQLYKKAGLYYYNPFNPAEDPEPLKQ